ncbi:hypothetical protein HC229_11205 [Flavobacterium sp. D33]|nr:hypothetical protein [Flavobacterium selenitireducens]
MITTKMHGILDYLVAGLFIALPFLGGWDTTAVYSRIFFVLAAITIVYSLVTKYETSLVKLIPFRIHLAIDFISGILLISSPWLLGFADEMYLPHVVLGVVEILVVVMTVAKAEEPETHTSPL